MCKSSKMVSGSTRVIQVSNIAPQATKDQMQTLFGYLGKIDDIRLYPTIRDVSCPVQSRICYVKYYDSSTVSVAQHLTNTVFIDRALIVIPMQSGEIPDEHKALEMLNNGTLVPGLNTVEPRLPSHIVNSLEGAPPNQVIQTHDPNLVDAGLPPYPPLSASYDSKMVEEVRRTLLVVDTGPLTHQQLIDHFCEAGEVKYLRFCERSGDQKKYALIEMTEQESIIKAFHNINGSTCDGTIIQIQHATQPISKPQTKSNEAAQREIEEAMYRVKEAQNLISAAIDPVIGLLSKDKRRTRSRSRSRSRRSRSRHRSKRRSRSRSRHRSRRRSRSKHRHRSSRSRSRHRSSRRSRSPSRRHGSRSRRSRDRRDKTDKEDKKDKDDKKEPSPATNHKDKEEHKTESTENGNGSEIVSKASTPADDKEKEVEKEKEKTPSKKKDRSRSRDRKRDRSKSRRRSRSRSKRKRSRSRRRSKSRKRSKSRERKRSRSRDRKRSRSRDRKRSRSKDRKRSKSRDKKRSRSRDRKRSRSRSRRSKSRSRRESKNTHSKKSERSPNLPTIEEKDITIVNTELADERNSPDNMDISNSP